jgi:hypothetical protein
MPFERDARVVLDAASNGDIVALVGLEFEEEDEWPEQFCVFEEEMLLVDLLEQEEVDNVDEGCLAEVVAVLVRLLWFGDVREDDG